MITRMPPYNVFEELPKIANQVREISEDLGAELDFAVEAMQHNFRGQHSADEPSELLAVLGAIESVSGDDFCADLEMRNANRKLHGAPATAYEKLGQIYRLAHAFNTQNSCHHVHTNWREELKKFAAPGSVPQAPDQSAALRTALEALAQDYKEEVRNAETSFAYMNAMEVLGVPQAEPPKEGGPEH